MEISTMTNEQKFVNALYDKYGMSVMYENGYVSAKELCGFSCSIHGSFTAQPKNVMRNDMGCKKCGLAKMAKTKSASHRKFKDTYNDLDARLFDNIERYTKISDLWNDMLTRCYANRNDMPTYKGCEVSNSWKHASNFYNDIRKLSNYEMIFKGYQLDKDILVKGNKIYECGKCCIVPKDINNVLVKSDNIRGELPIGVRFHKGLNKYTAQISCFGKQVYLGSYSNTTDAFTAYKVAKEAYIRELADKYCDSLTENVYDALVNYKVEITD